MRAKFLLRPGWISLVLLVVVFSSICFTLLAPWQFSRNEQTQERNAAIKESFNTPPGPLNEVLPGGRAPGPRTEWTQVTFSGHYLPEGQTVARLRTVLGEPAYEVLTPFRLDSGEAVLVNRGYVRPVQGTAVPPFPPPPRGRVTLTARVRADEHDSERRDAFEKNGYLQVYAINSATVGEATGIGMRPGYFALTPGQPGVLGPLPLPQLDSGPYFSYALQWIAFGVMAPLGVGYLIYREFRPGEGIGPAGTGTGGGRPKLSVAEAVAEDERREREEQGHDREGTSSRG